MGQQYLDAGKFDPNSPAVLKAVGLVNSNAPRNFETFEAQAQEVEKGSPRMGRKYEHLYNRLRYWAKESGDPKRLQEFGINTQQLVGADKQGNVLYTGYFSPVIEMRHKPDRTYKYPVYKMPYCQGRCPSRAQIYNGALAGKGLELGYTKNLIDPFLMEVQGSGFVHYGDTDEMDYFAYGGKNGHRYTSIGRKLIEMGEVKKEDMSMKAIKEWVDDHSDAEVRRLLEMNPSYVFFQNQGDAKVRGAAGIPLLPMAAVAGDKRFFPMGTPILAEVPLLDKNGKWTGKHELRLLIVLDVGGAVKKGHFDLYYGMGEEAGTAAGHYQHFGRAWKLF
ncbi:MAG: murein transglycosylase A [Vibrio sp.]